MGKKNIILAVILLFIVSSACAALNSGYGIESLFKKKGEWDEEESDGPERVKEPDPNNQSQSSKEGESDSSEDTTGQSSDVNFLFAHRLDDPLFESLDEVLDMIFREQPLEARANITVNEETKGDNIFSKSSIVPGGHDPASDIILSGHFRLDFPIDTSIPPMEARVPCGMETTIEDQLKVLCTGTKLSSEIKTWYIFFMAFQDRIPLADETRHRTLAVVLDSDQKPENNFSASAEWDYDLFQDTDLWYLFDYSPQNGWKSSVLRADGTEVESEAKALIYRNTFSVVIPGNELVSKNPGWRGSASSHEGLYLAENYFGNVTLELPTLGPIPVKTESFTTLYIPENGMETWLEGGDKLCQWSGCKFGYNLSDQVRSTWCECDGCTNNSACECALFTSDPLRGSGSRDGTSFIYWTRTANQNEPYPSDTWNLTKCFCVEKKK